jgi:hypothetical protein
MDTIPVANGESCDGRARRFIIATGWKVQAHSLPLMIRIDAIDHDVTEFRRHRGPARIAEHIGQCGFTF